MPDAQSLAQQFHVDLHDILDAFDILESDGYLKVYRVGGGGGGSTAQLTGTGKKILLQADSGRSPAKAAQPSTNLITQPRRTSSRTSIFISHIHEESGIALVLKEWIGKVFPTGCKVFVSSDQDDIPAGTKWFDKIDQSLHDAGVFLILCSSESMARPWINFESGCAWMKQVPILPICHSGASLGNLPPPLSMFQGLDMADAQFPSRLCDSLATHSKAEAVSSPDFETFRKDILKAMTNIPKQTPETSTPPRTPAPTASTHSSVQADDLAEEEVRILKVIADKGDHGNTSVDLADILSAAKARLDYRMTDLFKRGLLEGNAFTTGGRVYHLTQKARQYLFTHNLL